MTKAELMTLIGERDALDDKIEAGMTELGLDKAALRKLVSATKKAEAAQKTLRAMMELDLGDNVVKEVEAEERAADPA